MRPKTGLLSGAGRLFALLAVLAAILAVPSRALAQQPEPAGAPAQAERTGGGEASLVLPDLNLVDVGGYDGRTLLMGGMVVAALGIAFGLIILTQLKNLPVHRSMREVSELIYETCKTYLTTQGKFILVLWTFIAVIIGAYYGWLNPIPGKPIAATVAIILAFSLLGIAGSYGVAWFGIRVNTF
ncbi:MAG TPA: sodium/proton-translocating pyrophosphatase, partial [Vicinamibacterales bacterium]